LPNHWGIVQR